ncbi:MAG: phosphoglucomutase/phosphomannomutase family protein [Pyrinomonadaceae bacterium]
MKTTATASSNFIRFGTDGWRAIIGDEFTFANLKCVAQAYADYINDCRSADESSKSLSQNSDEFPLIIIGFDGRFLSAEFARRAAEVLAGNNLKVALFAEPVPTPLVSWGIREMRAAGGIVITASHNPPEYNGFKIKSAWGGSASPDVTSAVESRINLNSSPELGNISENDSAEMTGIIIKSYRAHLSSYIDLEIIRSAKAKVIIDSMHGCGTRWIESFLRKGTIKAETIRSKRDPLFGGVNPEPIDCNLYALKNRVLETGAILGLATDGDADRLGAVDERGETMTTHQIVSLLLLHLIRNRKMTGAVAYTFSQSVITKRIAAAHNLPLYETPIGFKHIAALMLKENVLVGAEESGGIGVQNHMPERDGILNSLLLLEAVTAAGKTPSKLVHDIQREFGEFYFERLNLKMGINRGRDFIANLARNPPLKIAGEKVAGIETLDGVKLLFADESWLLLRQSGTEPVLRVYAEATSVPKMKALLKAGDSMSCEM